MDAASYYLRVVQLALQGVVGTASSILLFLFILLGVTARLWPGLTIWGQKVSPEWAQAWRVSIIVLVTIIAFRLLVAPFWIWKKEHAARAALEQQLRNPTTISFEYENSKPFIQPDTNGQLWIRVKANNNGPSDIVCRMYINRLEKIGVETPLWSNHTLLLLWAGNEDEFPGNTQRTVPARMARIFNLAYIAKDSNELSIQHSNFASEVSEKLSPGTYKFTIQAIHSTCRSEPTEISIKYDGQQRVSFVMPTIGGH